jgi:hypothetical protein
VKLQCCPIRVSICVPTVRSFKLRASSFKFQELPLSDFTWSELGSETKLKGFRELPDRRSSEDVQSRQRSIRISTGNGHLVSPL